MKSATDWRFIAEELYHALTHDTQSIAIYGAGGTGKEIYQYIKEQYDLEIFCFLDNDPGKVGKSIDGVEIKKPDSLIGQNVKVIVGSIYIEEIYAWLIGHGFNDFVFYLGVYYAHPKYREEICKIEQCLKDKESKEILSGLMRYYLGKSTIPIQSQYEQYMHPAMNLPEKGKIVDGGAHIGETSDKFLLNYGRDKQIFAFEPSPHNFQHLETASKDWPSIKIYNSGLWSDSGTQHFNANIAQSSSSTIVERNTQTSELIEVAKLDDIKAISQLDLLKLDVEGAELPALMGACDKIQSDSPNLAICIYHKPEDWLTIPQLLMELAPEHDYYLGHHSHNQYETVFYAIRRNQIDLVK